jgi:hypothetical protein
MFETTKNKYTGVTATSVSASGEAVDVFTDESKFQAIMPRFG